jgi:hypothetical protein
VACICGAARAGRLTAGSASPPHRAVMSRIKKSPRQKNFDGAIEKCRRDLSKMDPYGIIPFTGII